MTTQIEQDNAVIFKSQSKIYTVDERHFFQDNGSSILYLFKDSYTQNAVSVSQKEFKRIKDKLVMSYTKGFGGIVLKIYNLPKDINQ